MEKYGVKLEHEDKEELEAKEEDCNSLLKKASLGSLPQEYEIKKLSEALNCSIKKKNKNQEMKKLLFPINN